jgi:hypothetical protein
VKAETASITGFLLSLAGHSPGSLGRNDRYVCCGMTRGRVSQETQ